VDVLDDQGRAQKLGQGVANLGVRPTVAAGQSFEVHVFDFDGDLYGRSLRVHLVERLREERRFADLNALKAQIALDSERARAITAGRVPDPDAAGAWH